MLLALLSELRSVASRSNSAVCWSRVTRFNSLNQNDHPLLSVYYTTRTARAPKTTRAKSCLSETATNEKGGKITLTEEQKFVVKRVVEEGKSLFFTGSAGTGKSVLLREIIRRLHRKRRRVEVTASTGLAAVNIGGKTLHAFAGAGLGKLPVSEILKQISSKAKSRWRETDILIIDEISMVEAWWFDLLNELSQELRENHEPFGGLQVVISGDFFQLPPVSEDKALTPKFAFEADSWTDTWPETFKLTQVFRQSDPKLINMLNEIRRGEVSNEAIELLTSLSREPKFDDGILPTEIFPFRKTAEMANEMQLRQLPDEPVDFVAVDLPGEDAESISEQEVKQILAKLAPIVLRLAVGAQVMCTKNFPGRDIINGSIGRVVEFMTQPEAKDHNYPILGMSGGRAKADAPPPATDKKPIKWPLVEFIDAGKYLVTRADFKSQNQDGEVIAHRPTIDFGLGNDGLFPVRGWLIIDPPLPPQIHKAQGQTIPRLKIDLRKTFADGQAYVAISRCKSLEGLQILNFSPKVVLVNPKVLEWDRKLALAT
ncbi:ATP-dependent DNA helicase pfh1 [Ceratobasidium theobromae]|uniref:ATP-dependent DNA helicase n=1 Tax=Ceratobasidium theobromae TaxID=1582974 RepID=A0A5N5Q9D9_9AGAM|nr:ATP-dependent DNA helicase pfh1 [Ceratobasidium theobromae]